jgi:chromosome segregation ATPase
MHRFERYVDLRQNVHEPGADDSVWPTFTDIMTVVLMLFMLTMVLVIIKNSNISAHLKTTVKKQEAISGLLKQSELERLQLEKEIAGLEDIRTKKEMQLMLLTDEKKVLNAKLGKTQEKADLLESKIRELNTMVVELQALIAAKESRLRQAREQGKKEIEETRRAYEERIASLTENQKKELEEFDRKHKALLALMVAKEQAMRVLAKTQEELGLTLARQRSEYSKLEEKYNKLIRPSRSSLGKVVVSVVYSKKEGKHLYSIKDVKDTESREVGEKELEKILAERKKTFGDKLYVRVIIPEGSGLSYNEAWTFTRHILSTYDYYYQKKQNR